MENGETILMEEAAKVYNIRHRCFHFAKEVLKFIDECKYQRIHFSILDQLLRSATSIGANVVEGGSGSSRRDFLNFFHISLKSANDYETLDLNKDKLEELLREADELSKIIAV
jgi:four helix bundle protein